LRFPVYRWLSGVGFFDAGNVFGKVSAFELNELRSAIGAGLRFDSPVGLLRVDLGVPLDRSEGASRTRWHFAIGHAF
jgi:outer membrane protein insertion porin family